jgi:hypothetical protein
MAKRLREKYWGEVAGTHFIVGLLLLVQLKQIQEAHTMGYADNRERFDYTEWRKNQWQDETVESLATRARTLRGIDRT